MTGMRKRVTAGFLSIVCLLFFSGMVSFLELSRLSRDTDEILGANQRSIRLAREMLDAVHGQSRAMARRAVFGDRSYDSLCRAGLERLEEVLLAAQKEAADRSALDSLAFATTGLRLLTDRFLASDAARRTDSLAVRGADSLGARWYRTEYGAYYDRLVSAINYYMTSTQSSLAPRAEQMKTNAYRAVTPVLISLAVMIAIVLMLYYFIFWSTVSGRSNGWTRGWTTTSPSGCPFAVKGEFKDEMLSLREKIEALINLTKQAK